MPLHLLFLLLIASSSVSSSDHGHDLPSTTSFDVTVTLGSQDIQADIQIGDTARSAAAAFLQQHEDHFDPEDPESVDLARQSLTVHLGKQIVVENQKAAKMEQESQDAALAVAKAERLAKETKQEAQDKEQERKGQLAKQEEETKKANKTKKYPR